MLTCSLSATDERPYDTDHLRHERQADACRSRTWGPGARAGTAASPVLLCLPPEWPLTPNDFRDESITGRCAGSRAGPPAAPARRLAGPRPRSRTATRRGRSLEQPSAAGSSMSRSCSCGLAKAREGKGDQLLQRGARVRRGDDAQAAKGSGAWDAVRSVEGERVD